MWILACWLGDRVNSARVAPAQTRLELFLADVAAKVAVQQAANQAGGPDIVALVTDIKQRAAAADKAADDWDAATSKNAADAAKENFDQAREQLFDPLARLAEFRFWARGAKFDELTVESTGCGLLNVETWIYQRDPSIFKVLHDLQDAPDQVCVPDLMWRLEARSFVFPERGPLQALIQAMGAVGVQWLGAIVRNTIAALQIDDFWIPAGTKSLEALKAAVGPAHDNKEPQGQQAVTDEQAVRQALANNEYQWSWGKLRDALSSGSDEDRENLQGFLVFRKALTDRLMLQAVAKVAQDVANDFHPYRWVRYAVPGSTRLTSDIDVNMRGSATEKVVKEFNSRFRAWTIAGDPKPEVALESGYVFDVNVYAQDYTRELGLRFLKPEVPDADFWPADGTPERTQAERHQDVYALLKMKRYMPDDDWEKFCSDLSDEIASEGASSYVTLTDILDRVNELSEENETEAQTARTAVLQAANRQEASYPYPENLTMRAENDRYEAQLDKVYQLRGKGPAQLNGAEKVTLAEALGKAMFLAQEAYHSSGAVRDVVCNLQMGQGLTLTVQEQLHSFNEQVGDIFKELAHFPAPPQGDVSIEFAVDASKYMVRLANAALGATYNIVSRMFEAQMFRLAQSPTQSSLLKMDLYAAMQDAYIAGTTERLNDVLVLQSYFETWRTATRKLMEVKDKRESFKKDGAWNDDALLRFANAPWLSVGTFREVVVALAVTMNVEVRRDPRGAVRSAQVADIVSQILRQHGPAAIVQVKSEAVEPALPK
jgi:hypothetical protein